jgi:hypothetical protein
MSIFDLFKKKRTTILVNGSLNVTFKDGSSVIFHDADEHLYQIVSNKELSDNTIVSLYYEILDKQKAEQAESESKKSLKQIIETKEVEKIVRAEKQEEVQQEIALVKELGGKFGTLVATGDFAERNGAVYMITNGNEIPLSIPKILLSRFVYLLQQIEKNNEEALDEYVALQKFWLWSSLCPNPQSREDLFGWIDRNKLKINKNGFFFAYRKVVSVNNTKCASNSMNKTLSEFISNSYLKIKAAKKGPKNYFVERSPENGDNFILVREDRHTLLEPGDFIGNLYELHENILVDNRIDDNVEAQTYTDNYTGKMSIKLGHEVSLPADHCDWNNLQSCSAGLHLRGDKDLGFGDTTILILVNPMNVVAVPLHNNRKMRVRAYFPVAVVMPNEDGKILRELNTMELAEEYYSGQITELKTLVANNAPKELTQKRITADLSPEAIRLLANDVENIDSILKKRTILV